MLTASQVATIPELSAEDAAAVDAYINSPGHRAWEQRLIASWRRGPSNYELHTAAVRAALGAKRRAAQLQRTPAWADLEAIRAVYARAQATTRQTGLQHHVDHDIPLQGKLVSGLHVHNNLQILPGEENRRKSNRFEVEL